MDDDEMMQNRRTVMGSLATATGLLMTGQTEAQVHDAVTKPASAAPVKGVTHIVGRDLPHPASISPEAKAFFDMRNAIPLVDEPPLADKAAWRKWIAMIDDSLSGAADAVLGMAGPTVETRTINGVTVHVAKGERPEKPHLYLHGGAFVLFRGKVTKMLTKLQAIYYGGTVYGVDYRAAQDAPYPAALDDCLSVYRALLKEYAPEKILVSGESAGANLSGAMMHRARDVGLPRPGALFLNTPATDLTRAGDSWSANEYVDVLLRTQASSTGGATLYVGDADPKLPYLSPLFGDHSRGFPPTYLRTGTRDMLISDTARMHAALRQAGVEADLYVGEAMPHGGLGGQSPEDEQARQDLIRWLGKHWLT